MKDQIQFEEKRRNMFLLFKNLGCTLDFLRFNTKIINITIQSNGQYDKQTLITEKILVLINPYDAIIMKV